MQVQVINSLEAVSAATWNALAGTANPFLRHEFLIALERNGSVGPGTGWAPSHLLLKDGDRLLASAPAYLKTDSWGEFVFDWAWANAYRQAGRSYYPKLVAAVPYTPATGPRILVANGVDKAQAAGALAEAGRLLCERRQLSSMHWLFPDAADADSLRKAGLSLRSGCQFHWTNGGYRDFSDFLDSFSSKKRKNVRRERRQAAATGLDFTIVAGNRIEAADWAAFHDYYRRTFHDHGNLPVLNLGFFQEIGRTLGSQVVMVQGRDAYGLQAAALLFRSDDALFGRYWGCREERPGVHFETCYYQGIEYCIREGLARFEPGAQGEHKIARGFLPSVTRSCHWIADPGFRRAVQQFLGHESMLIERYMEELHGHSPYRHPPRPHQSANAVTQP